MYSSESLIKFKHTLDSILLKDRNMSFLVSGEGAFDFLIVFILVFIERPAQDS